MAISRSIDIDAGRRLADRLAAGALGAFEFRRWGGYTAVLRIKMSFLCRFSVTAVNIID
jgi:hypothetical protein